MDSPHHNGVLRCGIVAPEVEPAVERLLAPFDERRLPLQWWVFTPPAPELATHRPRASGPGVRARRRPARDGGRPDRGSGRRRRRRASRWNGVVDDDGFASWAGVVARAFDVARASPTGRRSAPSGASGSATRRPSGTSSADRRRDRGGVDARRSGRGVAGLANIAVVPELRGRGLGAAVAAAALSEARDLGIEVGALSAGELGLPLYRRLGFRTVSRHRTYVRPRPQPDRRSAGRGLHSVRGPADLRPRERVRRDLHVPRPAAAVAGRGRPVPVPAGRALGPVLERVPRERRPPVPRRRLAPRVRDARVRRDPGPRRARQGGGADPRGAAGGRRGPAARGGHQRAGLPVQEQHRLGRATRTAATRTTWWRARASSRAWPTC